MDYRVRTLSKQVGGEGLAERSEPRERNGSWGLGRLGVRTHPIPFLLCKEHRGMWEARRRPMNVTESPVYVFIAKQCKPQYAQTCLSTYQQGIRNRQASLTVDFAHGSEDSVGKARRRTAPRNPLRSVRLGKRVCSLAWCNSKHSAETQKSRPLPDGRHRASHKFARDLSAPFCTGDCRSCHPRSVY